MRTLKNIVGVLSALMGIAYCGSLILYFVGGWGELGAFKSLAGIEGGIAGANAIGLGPTILGLGAIGLVFVITLIVRILRLIVRRDPSPDRRGSRPRETLADDDGAAADTMIARYLAQRSAEAAAPPPQQPLAPRPAVNRSPGPQRPSFGRRIR
ncbi:hypothetical protein [Bosea sp. (in: a-proteobacteria)]|uniref:hypothetical protein n=1 Tax=Bosea sp. (in: a-proteobacteria) TaxID=1871050 RepID=UPI002635EC9A|nr:hypothetical protein [Bosea sp. (in: a-proteobacteria)]MCO5092138.1 hypothetical protein [Bosea sp. (in: a-proteobacteria)]